MSDVAYKEWAEAYRRGWRGKGKGRAPPEPPASAPTPHNGGLTCSSGGVC
jgi:hypothetical protein